MLELIQCTLALARLGYPTLNDAGATPVLTMALAEGDPSANRCQHLADISSVLLAQEPRLAVVKGMLKESWAKLGP